MRPLVLFTALLALGAGPADDGFRVTTDRTVDASSLQSFVRDSVARAGAKTNDEKAVAIYEALHHALFHFAYPTEAKPLTVGPLKALNVYGWSLCGGQHTVLKALFETAGWEVRYVGWPGHTTVEVKYDGRWHYFDVFLKCYYWSKGKGHVVSQAEIAADPTLVLDAVKDGRAARENLCCGDAPEDVVAGCRARKVVGPSDGWGSVTGRDDSYSPRLTLPAGATLRLDWKGEPKAWAAGGFAGRTPLHTCGDKDFRADPAYGPVAEHYGPRGWSNGRATYAPDFAYPAGLAAVELSGARADGDKLVATAGTGVAVFKLPLPYPAVTASFDAAFGGGAGKVSVSGDGGATWQPAAAGDVSKALAGRYDLRVKVEFPGTLARVKLDAVVEHNRGVLPHLLPGKNAVTVDPGAGGLPKDAVLSVTYEYQEATAPPGRTRFDGRGVTYGPVVTVTRDLTAAPTTFDIVVVGNTPPKMLSLTRSSRPK